jgi:hypothetical protein
MARDRKNGAAKATSHAAGKPTTAKPGKAKRSRAGGGSRKTTTVGEVVEVTVQARPEQVPAPAEVRDLARDLGEARTQLRAVLKDVRALRAERGEMARELGELRELVRVVVKEAAAHVADLRHVRRETGGELGAEPEAAAPPEPGNRLGLTVDPGVVIDEVLPGGPAASAGLARGDVVESVNGQHVFTAAGLRDAVLTLPEGAQISLGLRRGGEPMEMIGRLGAAEGEGGNRLGLVVAPGVVVAGVAAGGAAEAAGLARGDVVVTAAGQPVHGGDQLRSILAALPPGADLELSALRSGEVLDLVARLDGPPVSP